MLILKKEIKKINLSKEKKEKQKKKRKVFLIKKRKKKGGIDKKRENDIIKERSQKMSIVGADFLRFLERGSFMDTIIQLIIILLIVKELTSEKKK